MSNFEQYLNFIWWKLPFVLLVSLLAALVAYGVTARLGPAYEAHFSYLISMSEREAAPDFRFDGYYAISATDLFADTLAQWVATPEVVVAAYQAAGLPLNEPSPRQLTKIIRAEKSAPQLVHVTIRTNQEETTKKLTAALQHVMDENIEQYLQQGIPAVQFRLVASQPWVGIERPATPVIVIATLMLVFLLAINSIIIWVSLGRL